MKHFLTISVPDQKSVKYALKGKTITVGRASTNAITLEIPEVSSKHLEVRAMEDGGYQVVDLESTNGTTVNGEKITEHRLADGDELVIGLYGRAKYAAVADEAAAQASPAQPLQPKVVAENPRPASPTVVLKKAPNPASPARQAPAQAPESRQPAAPPGVKVRKMTPPGAKPAEPEPEAEESLPVAQAIPDESAEAETETPARPKLAVPNPSQGPKKLNLG